MVEPLERLLRQKEVFVERERPTYHLLLEPVDPDRWYGCCYGRELDDFIGEGYR